MGGSLRIARIAGIDIKVHFSFLLIVLLGAWQWGSTGPAGAVFGAVLTLMVFACVALHELGHSLVAKAFGIPVKDITLLPIGGIAQLGRKPETPGQELLIAIAGPAVNVLIAVALFVFSMFVYGPEALFRALQHIGRTAPTIETLWAVLMTSNVALAVFNLLPAFPMDGGRVFRALLSFLMSAERATRIASVVGRVIAVGLFALGLFTQSPMLPFIAVFIFFGAGAELRDAQVSGALQGIRAGDAVNPYVPRFSPDTTVGEAVRALVYTPHPAFAVEHFGRLLGVVTRGDLVEAAQRAGPSAWISGVMRREVPVVQAHESLDVARQRMGSAQTPFVAVMDRDLFLGVVTELELAQQTMLALALRSQMRPPGSRQPASR